jgi:hypothetical protein
MIFEIENRSFNVLIYYNFMTFDYLILFDCMSHNLKYVKLLKKNKYKN